MRRYRDTVFKGVEVIPSEDLNITIFDVLLYLIILFPGAYV